MTTIFDRISCGEIGNDAIPVDGWIMLDATPEEVSRIVVNMAMAAMGQFITLETWTYVDHEGMRDDWVNGMAQSWAQCPWHDMLGIPHCMSEATYPRVAEQIQCNMKAIVYYSGILAIECYWFCSCDGTKNSGPRSVRRGTIHWGPVVSLVLDADLKDVDPCDHRRHRGAPWGTVGHRAWYHGTMSSFSSRRPVAGSTVVMKAINTNHEAALKKAPFTDPVEPVECEV